MSHVSPSRQPRCTVTSLGSTLSLEPVILAPHAALTQVQHRAGNVPNDRQSVRRLVIPIDAPKEKGLLNEDTDARVSTVDGFLCRQSHFERKKSVRDQTSRTLDSRRYPVRINQADREGREYKFDELAAVQAIV